MPPQRQDDKTSNSHFLLETRSRKVAWLEKVWQSSLHKPARTVISFTFYRVLKQFATNRSQQPLKIPPSPQNHPTDNPSANKIHNNRSVFHQPIKLQIAESPIQQTATQEDGVNAKEKGEMRITAKGELPYQTGSLEQIATSQCQSVKRNYILTKTAMQPTAMHTSRTHDSILSVEIASTPCKHVMQWRRTGKYRRCQQGDCW